MAKKHLPKEGDLYKVIKVGETEFTIYYGYYSESDRFLESPMPILPDFLKNPQYSSCGRPFVTRIQDACEHYKTHDNTEGDGWCADCKYYLNKDDDIALCKNKKRLKIISNDNPLNEAKEV